MAKIPIIPFYEMKEEILLEIQHDIRLLCLIAVQREVSERTVFNWTNRDKKQLTTYETIQLISKYLKRDDLVVETTNNIQDFNSNNH